MNLIIGKNSSIVQDIKDELNNFLFCSHTEINKFDPQSFDNVVVFSWSHTNITDNYKIIKYFSQTNIIFISSTAVLALNKRKQWNRYPNWKKEIEDYIFKINGRVIRIGVWNKENIKGIYGYLPYTSRDRLINELNKINIDKKTVVDCFEIAEGELSLLKKYLSISLNNLATLLPSLFIFQAPIEFTLKLFGIKSYGYTNDSNYFFRKSIMIGRGCLGSEYLKYNKVDLNLVSFKTDISLSKEGFVDTIIGYKNNGLAKYWHGVYIKKSNGNLKKIVPLFVKRGKSYKSKTNFHVTKLNLNKDINHVYGFTKKNKESYFYSKEIILAAGPIENARLLSDFWNDEVLFDDHELITIGSISLNCALQSSLVRVFGPFILKGFLSNERVNNERFLIDPRPLNYKKNENNIYADTTTNIIKKIIFRFSFTSLNEAFFNKFGVALKTKRITLSLQILSNDCIKLKKDGIERSRINQSRLNQIKFFLSQKFKSFDSSFIRSFDGQHIMGGKLLLENKELRDILLTNQLKILGSPCSMKLDEFHHTEMLKSKVRRI